jgi:hypothetical protein
MSDDQVTDAQDRVLSAEGFDQLAAETLDPYIGGATQKTRRVGTGPAIAVPDRPAASFVVGIPQYGQNDLPPENLTGQQIAAYESARASELSPPNRYLGLWNNGTSVAMDVAQSTPGTREGLQQAQELATSGERHEDAIGYFDHSADYDQTIDLRDVGAMLDVSWQEKYSDQPNLVPPPGVTESSPVPDPGRRREALTEAVTPMLHGSWKGLAPKAVGSMGLEDVSRQAAYLMNTQRHAAFRHAVGEVETRQAGVIDSPGGDSGGSALT